MLEKEYENVILQVYFDYISDYRKAQRRSTCREYVV